MGEGTLFELPPEEERVVRPVRQQLQWVASNLFGDIPTDIGAIMALESFVALANQGQL